VKFGPDGYLYVAEAGLGGTTPATGDQVPPPVGPYTGGKTSRISKIGPTGERITVADGLPSDQTSPDLGSLVSGVADIDFIGASLYAVDSAGGASHGNSDVPNSVIHVNQDGTVAQIADLSAFLKANPVKNPQPNDFEPDGTWYSLTHIGSDLYAVEPNHGELDKITLNGQVSRVVDISDSQGHIVPTSVAVGPDGNFYVGNLTPTPYTDGSAKILKITPTGDLSIFATGLTTVLGVAFDSQGRLYALESSTGNTPQPPFLVPGSGKVVRVSSSGSLETVVSGLTFPTSMTFGPDGKIYVSNKGFAFKEGEGEIVAASVT
jgi:sugar lactone lactonase YvrE